MEKQRNIVERGMEKRRYEEIKKNQCNKKRKEEMSENSKFCLFTNKMLFLCSQVMLPRVNHLKNSSPG